MRQERNPIRDLNSEGTRKLLSPGRGVKWRAVTLTGDHHRQQTERKGETKCSRWLLNSSEFHSILQSLKQLLRLLVRHSRVSLSASLLLLVVELTIARRHVSRGGETEIHDEDERQRRRSINNYEFHYVGSYKRTKQLPPRLWSCRGRPTGSFGYFGTLCPVSLFIQMCLVGVWGVAQRIASGSSSLFFPVPFVEVHLEELIWSIHSSARGGRRGPFSKIR